MGHVLFLSLAIPNLVDMWALGDVVNLIRSKLFIFWAVTCHDIA